MDIDLPRRRLRLHRLMVTRPMADAQIWTESLLERGWPAQALPLIAIDSPQSPEALHALDTARGHWLGWDALMFVSAAAVKHFFSAGVPVKMSAEAATTRFWAPGPGTAHVLARALKAHGVDPAQIDSPPPDAQQFDSESLWPVVRAQLRPGRRLLVVRGASATPERMCTVSLTDSEWPLMPGQGRDWLMAQCLAAGAEVSACVAYERSGPAWGPDERARAAAAAGTGNLWLFSSSEALQHLQQLLPQVDWSASSALVTHPRIAHAARSAGFLDVQESRPSLDDVVRALESHWSPP